MNIYYVARYAYVYLYVLTKLLTNIFICVSDAIECSDYNGSNVYEVYTTIGMVRGLTIENDVIYYSTDSTPSR